MDGASQDSVDPFAGMNPEQKQQLFKMQRLRVNSCIIFSKLYLRENAEYFQQIIDLKTDEEKGLCSKKFMSRLILHCHQTASEEHITSILQAVQEGSIPSLSQMMELNTVDISEMEDPQYDCQLNSQEQQAFQVLEQYEKEAAKQFKQEESQKESSYSSGGGSSGKRNLGGDSIDPKDINILGVSLGSLFTQELTAVYALVVLFGCIVVVFYSKQLQQQSFIF